MRRKIIEEVLNNLFPNPEVPLDHEGPYTLLIATLLSAQCTDKRVNEITPLLFERAKTPEKMIQLSLNEIYEIIKPCGLGKKKADAIWHLSKDLLENYESKVPSSFEELESLPGIGHKTASCIMAHCFGIPSFPVDTHIHRLAKRFGLSSGKSVIQTEKDLKALFPKKSWTKLHLQLILYGRKYCQATKHELNNCPICKLLAD